MRTLEVHKLGRVEYADGLALMRTAAERVAAQDPPGVDYLFVLEHPPVLTLGRGAIRANVVASPVWLEKQGFEIHETDRGGDVTYHGPGQVVAYPVLDLNERRDVRRYVSDLEEAMIRACADHGLEAGRHPEHRGAWIGSKKIGAVGVHLSRWISSHGLAFNAAPDLGHFSVIVPCGIADPRLGVTSLAAELEARGQPAPRFDEVQERLAAHLTTLLGRRRLDRDFDMRTVSVVAMGTDDSVLLLRRHPDRGGFWQQVTGRVEEGESPAEAARRELTEETGARAEVVPLGYVHGFVIEPALAGRPATTVVTAQETAFVARLPAGFVCRLSEEHAEHGWFRPEEAAAMVRFAGLRRAIRMASGLGRRIPAAEKGA